MGVDGGGTLLLVFNFQHRPRSGKNLLFYLNPTNQTLIPKLFLPSVRRSEKKRARLKVGQVVI